MAAVNLLSERAPRSRLDRIEASVSDSDPFGIDIQLTLYVCYELHYRGFAGVDPGWEWNPGLLHLRARLEDAFLSALRRDVGHTDTSAAAEMDRLSSRTANDAGPAHFLQSRGTWEQVREYLVHHSLYQLKKGDPHAWAIPRLTGQAKASLAALELDGFGAGCGGRVHQQLFADLMVAADLDPAHLSYIDIVPAETLAMVNLISLFSLHRSHRGAAVGHFAATEITFSPWSRPVLDALVRVDAPAQCRDLYRQHLEAHSPHEQAVLTRLVTDLIGGEPDLEADVVFGTRAFGVLEDRLGRHLTARWGDGRTSLRRSLS